MRRCMSLVSREVPRNRETLASVTIDASRLFTHRNGELISFTLRCSRGLYVQNPVFRD